MESAAAAAAEDTNSTAEANRSSKRKSERADESGNGAFRLPWRCARKLICSFFLLCLYEKRRLRYLVIVCGEEREK